MAKSLIDGTRLKCTNNIHKTKAIRLAKYRSAAPRPLYHEEGSQLYTLLSIPKGFFRLVLKVVDAQKAARERDCEFRLPVHFAVGAILPLLVKPTVDDSDDLGGVGGGMSHLVSNIHKEHTNTLA